jgi:hypothetical protein
MIALSLGRCTVTLPATLIGGRESCAGTHSERATGSMTGMGRTGDKPRLFGGRETIYGGRWRRSREGPFLWGSIGGGLQAAAHSADEHVMREPHGDGIREV